MFEEGLVSPIHFTVENTCFILLSFKTGHSAYTRLTLDYNIATGDLHRL